MATLQINRRFNGVDNYTDPGDLAPTAVTSCYNMYVEGGDLKTRPGVVGLLTTPMANPIYSPFPYIKADLTEWIIFASGPANSTTGGKIYKVPATGGTPTEILDGNNGSASFNINAEAFRIALGGSYAYMVWGGNLYRTDLTASTASAVSSLNPPVVAPAASLTNVSLDSLLTTTGWSSDTLASGSSYIPASQTDINATATGNVTPGTVLNGKTNPNAWTAIGITPSIFPADGTHAIPATYNVQVDPYSVASTKWFALDDPGGGFQTGLMPVPALSAPEAYRNATQFYFRCYWYTSDTRSLQALKVICTAYNGSSAAIASQVFQTVLQYSGQTPGQTLEKVFNFAGLGTSIAYVQFQVVGGDANVNASVFPNFQGFTFSSGFYFLALSTTPQITFSEAPTGGLILTHVEPSAAYWGVIGGIYVTKDYGSGSLQNWSQSPVITFGLSSAPGASYTVAQLVAMGLKVNLILRQAASTTEYIAPLAFATDGSYMSVDLSAYVPIAIYSSFEYLSLEFTSSLNTTTPIGTMFTITGITQAGNLPVSGVNQVNFSPVYYTVEELNNFGDSTYADPLESSGGPPSNTIQATAQYAIGKVVVPVAINPSTTGFAIFRGGGTYTDGLSRLVATVPVGSDYVAPISYSDLVVGTPNTKVSSVARPFVGGDVGAILYILAGTGFNVGPLTVASVAGGVATLSGAAGVTGSTLGIAQLAGDPLLRDLQNPYATWNHTTRTLTDNTPDSFLNLALTLQFGRDLPPTSCSGVVYHQNRIWVSSGQVLSSSWSLTLDAQNGAYFTNVDLSTDPYAPAKGITFGIGYGDNDPIAAMLSAGSSLLVLKSRSAAVVDGYDPTNFAAQSYLTHAGLGCVASRAATICGNTAKAWFLGPDNAYMFNGDDTVPRSIPIQPVLHPNGYDGSATISTTAFSRCAMMYYDLRLFLFAPVAGGSQNSVAYVYDFRNDAWVTWGLPMTSGASLTGASSSTLGAFMGGYDGQLYTFAAGGDKATPASSSVAVPFSVVSRGFGQEGQGDQMEFLEESQPSRMFCMGNVPTNTPLTFTCYSDNNSAVAFSEVYTVSGKFVAQQFVRGVYGTQIFAGVSGAVLTQATIRALGVEIEKRKVPR